MQPQFDILLLFVTKLYIKGVCKSVLSLSTVVISILI